MFWLIFLYTLAASNFTIAKAVLSYSQPLFFVGVRMIIAGGLILSYFILKDKKLPKISSKDYLNFGLMILFHIYLAFAFDLVALQGMASSKGALIYNLSPFITAGFAYLYFDEKMTLKKYLGLIIGLLGILPEIMSSAPTEKLIGNFSYVSWSELFMIGSVISSVFGWTLFRRLVKKDYNPLIINGISMFGGGILSLLTSLTLERNYWNPVPISDFWPFAGLTALIILCANLLFYNLYGWMLKKYTSTFLSFAGSIIPLITAAFGWLFLGESVDWQFFFSLSVIVIGLSIFYSEELKQGYIIK